MTISNQALEKYEILEEIKERTVDETGRIKYKYLVHAKCKHCGKERLVNPANSFFKKGICRWCKDKTYHESILGLESNLYKVIGIDWENSKKEHSRHMRYFVQCKKCGHIFSRKATVIRQNLNNVQCEECKHNRNGKPLDVLHYKAYCYYRNGAISRNLDWQLSEEDFKNLTLQNCHYCGCEPCRMQKVWSDRRKEERLPLNGIDRVDPTKGYTKDNCVTCCKMCNQMKLDYDLNTFLNKIKDIYKYSIEGSTTISKESTSQANGDGNGELLTAA